MLYNDKKKILDAFMIMNVGYGEDKLKDYSNSEKNHSWGVKDKDALINVFGLDKSVFEMAYKQAVSGFEKDKGRILRFHSSALLALLCFYKVNKCNPIKIKDAIYTKCFFEVKNSAQYNNKHKHRNSISNVDIVLYDENKKTMLFLESKFTENTINNIKLKGKYEEWLSDNKLTEICAKDGGICDGIKQMIAHLLGVMKGPIKKTQEEYKEYYYKAEHYILGCVMHRKYHKEPKNTEGELFTPSEREKSDEYRTHFNDCMTAIKNTPQEKPIEIIEDILTYDDIFGNQNPNFLDKNVKEFYHIGKP